LANINKIMLLYPSYYAIMTRVIANNISKRARLDYIFIQEQSSGCKAYDILDKILK